MNRRVPALLALLLLAPLGPARASRVPPSAGPLAPLQDSIAYAIRVTHDNLCGITTTNYGFFGTNFVSRAPSFEYPLGSGYEHLVRGGLWIGAEAVDDSGSFLGVTTAAVDGTAGGSALAGSEFTPACLGIRERSTLPSSPAYDPGAISEEDLIGFYSDEPARVGSPEDHRPLDVLVRQESYDWSRFDSAHFVIVRFVIRNLGLPLRNAWVGLYTEFASGDKNQCSSFPPSASTCTDGSWFRKAWVQYDDSLRLFREHYCYNLPLPDGCQLSKVPEWAGLKLLGVSPGSLADPDKRVTLAAWKYSPADTSRSRDVQRYAIMSSGRIQDLSGPDFQPYTGDPCELLAVGPFAGVEAGDSIAVTFAFVGGAEIADIQQHARAAQRLYDSFYDITVPVEASLVSTEADPGCVRVRWYAAAAGSRWTVARSASGAPWRDLAAVTADGGGYATFEDRDVAAGTRYGYRLESSDGRVFGEAWVETPRALPFALRGARPNPAAGRPLEISFSLAERGRVVLEVLDAAGRRVLSRDLGSLEPGAHVQRLERSRALPDGTYFVRLRQAGRSASLRVVVLD